MKGFILLCLLLSSSIGLAASDEAIEWSSVEYQQIFGDFDGDGSGDFMIISKAPNYPSKYIPSSDPNSSPDHWIYFDPANQNLVAGDFNNDGKDEILVLSQTLEGHYLYVDQNLQLLANEDGLKVKGYREDRQIAFSHLYAADFNGDSSSDLLAYDENLHEFVIFHNKNKSKKIKFAFKDQLSLQNSSRFEPFISDFDADGNDDIALFSSMPDGESYVAFSSKKGRFKKAEFENITPYLGGEDWNVHEYSIINWWDEQANERLILRLQNGVGGIDEEGNELTGIEGQSQSPGLGLLDEIAQECQHLAYSPVRKEVYPSCGPSQGEASANNGKITVRSDHLRAREICHIPYSAPIERQAMASRQGIETQSFGCGEPQFPPSAPSSYPSVNGGSYHAVNTSYTVSMGAVSGAVFYQLYESRSNSNYSLVYSGSGTSVSRSMASYGHVYYKYRACNFNGCSAYSPYRRIYVYTNPGGPNNVSASTASLFAGGSSTISWTKAGGIIPSGYYVVRETNAAGSTKWLTQITAGSGSSYSYTVYPSGAPGSFSYRVQACNPSVGCGGSRSTNVTLNNRAPSADNESTSVNEQSSKTINVLSGDYDPDGHSLTISGYTQPSRGTVSCAGSNCTYTGTQNLSSNSSDSFQYTISDGYGGTDTATVSITLINQKEGTVSKPVISPTGRVFDNSQSISISTSTSGSAIYYTTNGSNPTTASTRYTGAFTITTDKTIKAIATKADYYNSAIDTEVFNRNYAPVAVNNTLSVPEDGSASVNVILNDSDPDGDELSVILVGTASHGSVSSNSSSVTYSPNANYCGNDSFTYVVSDGRLTDQATVSVSVNCGNDRPTISAIANQNINEDSSTGSIAFTVSDTDNSASSLGISFLSSNTALVQNSASKIVIGGSGSNRTVKVIPQPNTFGTTTITLTVSDGALTASRSFTVSVASVNDVPVVTPLAPNQNQSFSSTEAVIAKAQASDIDSSIAGIQFKLGNGSWTQDSSAPYEYNFGSLSAGAHTLYYRAKDSHNAFSSNKSISISVGNIPSASITSPAANQVFAASDSITVSASASDADGSITQVEFSLNGGVWQIDSSAPYSRNFGSLASGSHSVSVRAKDNSGYYSNAVTRNFSVAANQAPSASISSPSNGQQMVQSGALTVSASASDSDGSISRVEFRLNSGAWQSDTSAPYSYNFGSFALGEHTIQVRSRDNQGAYSTTQSVSVTIKPPVTDVTIVSGGSTGSFDVTWVQISGTTEYRIEEKVGSGSWTLIDTISSGLSKPFNNKPAQTYQYRVKACAGTSNCSDYSAMKSITVELELGQCPVP